MHIVRHRESDLTPREAPIFVGSVATATLVDAETDPAVTVTLVRFADGARNVWHRHTADQILYFVEGRGVVATRDEEWHLEAGDLAHVPAGTEHWHGAEPACEMAHLSILPPCQTEIVG